MLLKNVGCLQIRDHFSSFMECECELDPRPLHNKAAAIMATVRQLTDGIDNELCSQ